MEILLCIEHFALSDADMRIQMAILQEQFMAS